MRPMSIARAGWPVRLLAAAIAAGLVIVAAGAFAQGRTIRGSNLTNQILVTYGVGGVLKNNGTLYQWRPDRKRWVDIDESFRIDGEQRNVLPLPVQASEVARMEGFGFIVTRSGTAWLYNLDTNRWENIGRP